AAEAPRVKPAAPLAQRMAIRWNAGWVVAAVLASVAVGEGIWLIRTQLARARTVVVPAAPVPVTIDSLQPGARMIAGGRAVGVTPMALSAKPLMRSIHVQPGPPGAVAAAEAAPKVVDHTADAAAAAAALNQAAAARRGGLRVSSPIEIQVLE